MPPHPPPEPFAHLMVATLTPCRPAPAGLRRPPRHVHTYHAVALCVAGEGVYEAGAAYPLRAGDLYLVPAGTPHALTHADGLQLWGVGFCPACFAAQGPADLLAPFDRVRAGAAAATRADAAQRDRIQWLLHTLRDELGRTPPQPHSHAAQHSALSLLLVEVARALAAPSPAAPPAPLVAEALAWIERRCLDPISLRDVAAALRRSPSHLTAQVRAATGKTVQAWITAGRMAEARRRLLQTDERVDVIADRVGYADATHFIRTFRRHLAMTPAAWRRLHRDHTP